MPAADPVQLSFFDGLNAQAAPDKIGEGETPYAYNIDFSAEPGAARIRRGSTQFGTISSAIPITQIFRNYNNSSNIGASPFYIVTTNDVQRGNLSTWTTIYGSSIGDVVALGTYGDYTLIGGADSGLVMLKDDGTLTTDWIKQSPASAPVLDVINYSTAVILDTFVSVSGTTTATDTSTGTVLSGTAGGIVTFEGIPTSTDLSTISGAAIGDFGVNYISLSFSDPTVVSRITQDYSLNDTTFDDYLHYSVDLLNGFANEDVKPDADVLLSRISVNQTDNSNISRSQRDDLNNSFSSRRSQEVSMAEAQNTTFSRWGVARPKYQIIGQVTSTSGADPWANIGAVRLIIETTGPCLIKVTNCFVKGDEEHSLNDSMAGLNYWVTYAALDSDNNLIDQSAPSTPLTDVHVSYGQPVITHVGTATGSHGITHRILYRAGGYLPDAYAVATMSYTAGTATFTDTLSDIKALIANNRLESGLYSKSTFDLIPTAVCEHKGRVFVGGNNQLRWSLPGQPGTFPFNSGATVGPSGDEIQAMFSYGPSLVIVNRDSVYELRGNIFEGAEQDWVLQRTASRHGSKAARTCINTPNGILLLDYDGITFYQPGQGVDIDVKWIADKIGDVWRGDGSNDPAQLKGLRVQGLSRSYIRTSAAAYVDSKLYLALPCNLSTSPNIIFVIDFSSKRVWYYDYPFATFSLYWDFVDNKLLNGEFGAINQLENGIYDIYGTSALAIPYAIRSRTWTTHQDFRLENLSFEILGTNTVHAYIDNTSTTTVGVLTNTAFDWDICPLNGAIVNNIAFNFTGSSTSGQAVLRNVTFNALMEPPQVKYWRTEYDENNHTGENLWDVHHASLDIIGTGTITGVGFIDGAAVATFTNLVGPTNGRKTFHNAYPAQTLGNIAFTTYTSTSDSLRFKHWNTWYSARKEPAPVNTYKTEYVSLDENICDAHDVDINPNGTVTATVFVDNTAVGTYSYAGTARQSFVSALPSETYGRTIFAVYNGSGFKHYNTWWDLRPEPDRMTNYVVTRESKDEEIIRHVNWDMNCLGTAVTAIIYVDGTAVSTKTCTGSLRQSYVESLPDNTYGRTKWVSYTSAGIGKFKHYNTWFDTTPEPDRVNNLITIKESRDEEIVRHVNWDIDCLGNIVQGIVYVDGTAISTHTATGNSRQSYVYALPDETYGRTRWVSYSMVGGFGKFKHYDTWFDSTPEPDRISNLVTVKESREEEIVHSVNWDINPLGGTVQGIVYIDGSAVSTHTSTGTSRQSYVYALPNETYGRTRWVSYSVTGGSGRFKHYDTWFDTTPEPDRLANYVFQRDSKDEEWVRNVNWDINCLGGTVLSTVYLDGTAISTKTSTGSLRQSYVDSLPDESMGRTKWVVYNATGTGRFKHYNTWFDTTREPDRVSLWHERIPYSSENYIKTWVAELNPLGTTVGTMLLDGTAVWTNTFTGTRHQVFNVGVDMAAFTAQSTGTVLDIIYNAASGQRLKHYNTQCEAQPKPFGKKTWQIVYTKIGGTSRVDTARSFSLDIESSGTATVTSVWYVDGRAYNTNTLTFTGRQWREWIPLPPDGRGYIFHQEIKSAQDIRVWNSTLDMLREGAKGVSRVTAQGQPK